MLDALDEAFEALKTYDWGADTKALQPIEEAIVTTRDSSEARQELESRLAAMLKTDVTFDAKDYLCRKLRVVGTAQSVPTLAELLSQEQLSHMARYALERIPAPEAAQALRDALPKLNAKLKVGVIGSLGTRQDKDSIPLLAPLLGDADESVARSAALALGAIRTPAAARALQTATTGSTGVQTAVTDSLLCCAESILASGDKAQALLLYRRLSGADVPKHVKLAATRGMLACAGKTE